MEQGPSVLVIEDEPDARELCREVLAHAGYTVAVAGGGREALVFLEASASLPAVILTDLVMPDMGGVDFVLRLRLRSRHAAIPVVLMSASDNDLGAKQRSLFDRCVPKPIAPSLLLRVVASLTLPLTRCARAAAPPRLNRGASSA